MSPIRGVILAGGVSRRMGRDKATLVVDGKTLLDRALGLFHELGLPVSVSLRSGQVIEGTGLDRIDDPEPSIGPVGGLLAAMAAHPGTALLVVPVDLPGLDPATLRQLLEHRHPAALVTAFLSQGDSRVDPLCALYEPASRTVIERAVTRGEASLRRILEKAGRLHLIQPVRPSALVDADTADDLFRHTTVPSVLNPPCHPSA